MISKFDDDDDDDDDDEEEEEDNMSKNIQTVTTKLWAMANELRGNMDAAEYKNYILAFMFYQQNIKSSI